MCFPARNFGRLARTASFLEKHSSAMEDDVTTVTKREPKRRERTGPCFCESLWKVRCTGGLMRWRLPRIGIGVGPGGRLRFGFDRRKKKDKRTMVAMMIGYGNWF